MDTMPLKEVCNQAQPARRRPGVYGKRKGATAESRELHRQLFGTDENELEKNLKGLSIDDRLIPGDQPRPPSPLQKAVPKTPSIQLKKQSSPAAEAIPSRSRPQRRSKQKAAALTPHERTALAPILSMDRVESVVQDFTDFATAHLPAYTVTKAHEGSYSECFTLTSKTDPAQNSVLKIIPIEVPRSRTKYHAVTPYEPTEGHTTLASLHRELRILTSCEHRHGFAQIRSLRIVRGCWHPSFLSAYHTFKTLHPQRAINEAPDKRWAKDQMYGVIEMGSAGEDLDMCKEMSAWMAYDAFWMTVVFLGVAEREGEFEHRDLHLSNLCYRMRDRRNTDRKGMLLGRSGMEVTIIDYTVSRMRVEGGDGGGEVLFAVPDDGDEEGEMFSQAWAGMMCRRWIEEKAEGDWESFEPKTNVFWLAHVLDEVLTRGRNETGGYRTTDDEEIKVWAGMEAVKELFEGLEADEMPGCAEELLCLGLEHDWVVESDLKAFKERLNGET